MDVYQLHQLHLRFSQEVDDLEKELKAAKQNALQDLRRARNEIENRSQQERSMLQESLGTVPPNLGQFIDEKRDFYLRQATQLHEERLENDRKRFVEKLSAVNKKWRALPFDVEYASTTFIEQSLIASRPSLGTTAPELSNGTRATGTPLAMPSFMQNHPAPTQLAPKAQPAQAKAPVSQPLNVLPKPATAVPAASVQKAVSASSSTKRPIAETANEQQPAKRPSTQRAITFDEVYQNGNAKFKHIIVEYPSESQEYYILKCDDHGVHFGANPLAGAAKHLASKMHDHQSKNYNVAVDTLGFRVIGCNAELARMNNAAVEEAVLNGYKPVNLLQLSVGKRARFVEANPEFADSFSTPVPSLASPAVETQSPVMAPPTSRETAGPAMAPPPSRETPSPAKERRKSLHVRTPSDRSTRSAVPIPDPKPGRLYKGYWVGDKRHYPVMVLPTQEPDLSSCGLSKTLEETKLLKDVPSCYKVVKAPGGKLKLDGWAPGYEVGGPLAKFRRVPVMYFDRDMSVGWLSIKDVTEFNFDDPDWRQIPFFQNAVEYWESLNKVEPNAKDEAPASAQEPRLEPIPANLPEPARDSATPEAAAQSPPTAPTEPTTAPTASMALTASTEPTAASPRPQTVSATIPEVTQKPASPAAAMPPETAQPRSQAVSAAVSKLPAAAATPPTPTLSGTQPASAVVSKPAAAVPAATTAAPYQPQTAAAAVPKPTQTPASPKPVTPPTAASPRPQAVSAAVPKPPTAVVTPSTAAAAPTASKPVAPSTVSVPIQSGPKAIPPAVLRLAEMAKTDPQLRALIDRVSSKQGTAEENERLEGIVDRIAKELSSSGEAVKATVLSTQPKLVISDSKKATARVEASGAPASQPPSLQVPSLHGGKKGHGTGLKSPESSKPPTPRLTKATILSSAVQSPLVTAGPTPDTSTASSRTTSPAEASTSASIPTSNSPAKPATFVKAENGVATTTTPATTKTVQAGENEKFEVTIGKGSWNVETMEHMEDKLSVRLIASNQTKIASTAPGKEYEHCPYKFDIDPQDVASVVVENCATNAKTVVTIVLKKGRDGSGDKNVMLTFDRFVNPDSRTVESGRVQARRFCRWLRGVNTSIAYSNKSFK
ncbi:hypothetical protein B0T09DRAFT_141851 [Sordaria sp. MPI-SDFR-AT-0083]|nr:hypothetical protein B0T09DRAFT_141851 [Sordaria sp. MPI-SDFR-AT-0083]